MVIVCGGGQTTQVQYSSDLSEPADRNTPDDIHAEQSFEFSKIHSNTFIKHSVYLATHWYI